MQQEFILTYMTSKADITLDDQVLFAKIGPFVKKEIPLYSLQYFYIKEYKDYKELIIRYEKSNGKVANQRIYCGHGIDEINKLADALAQKFPDKDLRGRDPKEAMKLLKAVNMQKMAFAIVVLIIPLIMSIFFLPGLIHYFDFGSQTVTVEDYIGGKELTTRNLTLEGTVLNQGMWEKTTSSGKSGTRTTETNYFPLVNNEWKEGDPVFVILDGGNMTQEEIDEFVNQTSFKGTIRNVLWEGLESSQKDFFKTEYGMNLDSKVVLFEVIDGKPDEIMIYIYGVVLLITLVILLIAGIRYMRKS